MEDFNKIYAEYQKAVEARIEEFVEIKEPVSLYEPFKYIISGAGKRIRPILTMIASASVGGNPFDAVDAGCAIEILHNFTLVHDDIMDRSPIRRGKPTVHMKYNEQTAILTGDVMVGCAYEILLKDAKYNRFNEVYKEFTKGLIEVCEGQAYDMDYNDKTDVRVDDYLLMIDKKTSKILECCAAVGANCGEATNEEIEALRLYAHNLGIAFQIRDDILDAIAKEVEFGKRIGQDIIEGKKTLLILKALDASKETKDKQLLAMFMENGGLSEEYVPQMQDLLIRCGVIDYAQNEVEKYTQKAKDALSILKETEHKQMLFWLADKLNKRNY